VSLTRRDLLQTGGTAALGLLLLGSSAASAATSAPVAPYLRRSSYLGLSTPLFDAGGGSLRLAEVGEGTEEAFALTFTGAPLAEGVHVLAHPDLGSFGLYLVPGPRGATAVIDRSVPAARRAPRGPDAGDPLARATVDRDRRGNLVARLWLRTDAMAEVHVELVRGDQVAGAGGAPVEQRTARVPLTAVAAGRYDLVVTMVRADRSRTLSRRTVTVR
jgi:hypothetical protein